MRGCSSEDGLDSGGRPQAVLMMEVRKRAVPEPAEELAPLLQTTDLRICFLRSSLPAFFPLTSMLLFCTSCDSIAGPARGS